MAKKSNSGENPKVNMNPTIAPSERPGIILRHLISLLMVDGLKLCKNRRSGIIDKKQHMLTKYKQ